MSFKEIIKQCRMLLITLLEKLFERGLTGPSLLTPLGS